MFLELEVKNEVTDYIYMHISYRTAGYCDELRSASNVFFVAEPNQSKLWCKGRCYMFKQRVNKKRVNKKSKHISFDRQHAAHTQPYRSPTQTTQPKKRTLHHYLLVIHWKREQSKLHLKL